MNPFTPPHSQVHNILHRPTDTTPPPEDGLGEEPAHASAPPPRVGSLQQHSTLSVVMRTQEAERDQVGLQGEGRDQVGLQGEGRDQVGLQRELCMYITSVLPLHP